jgi:hypothetical protein
MSLMGQALSLLARQYLLLQSGFQQKHPSAWLWWESTEMLPPSAGVKDTWVPGESPAPAGGETMCFELTGGRIRIGSSAEAEVRIPLIDVADEACVLSKDSSGWKVAAGASVQQAIVDGDPVAAGIEVPLESGQVITVGEVKLLFLDAAAFAKCVAEAAKKLR